MNKRLQELEQENSYLKRLLEEHHIEYTLPKYIEPCLLSSNEKILAFLDYFRGRDDIFAYQYSNAEGKKSCFPMCAHKTRQYPYCSKNKKCSDCNQRQYRGITAEDIRLHLQGDAIYGIYPLLDDSTTHLLAFDFDDEDFKSSALAFARVCRKHGLDVLIEISQSGEGAHVWMFFATPIKASKVRKLGTHLLSDAMNECKGIDFSSFDRMFPSQDYLPKDGKYGNLIILPLQGSKAKEGKTLFVDDNFVPYGLSTQFSVLLQAKRIEESLIDVLLEKYKDDDVLGLLPKNLLKNLPISRNDFPAQLSILMANEVIVPKVGLSNKAIKFLYRLGSIPNPDYYQLVRRRKMIYAYGESRYPRVKRLYVEDDAYIRLPRGCSDILFKVLDHLKACYHIESSQISGQLISAVFLGQLREEQEEALGQLMKYEHGLFVAPPAFGKTVVAIALISRISLNTLIIVPKLSLIEQWRSRLDQFLSIGYEGYKKPNDKYGTYTGSKKRLTNYIDIASIDSLSSEVGKEILKRYGLIIFDEVHHVGALSYDDVARNCYSRYLYGFTATPKRSDGNHTLIYKAIGDIRYEHKKTTYADFARVLTPKFTHFTFSKEQLSLPYVEQLSLLLGDRERNQLIIDEISKRHLEKKNILLLTDRIEHIKVLGELLIKKGIEDVIMIYGDTPKEERRALLEKLDRMKEGCTVLSTGRFIGEGFDQSLFDTLFIASPFRWRGTLRQYVGRIHRPRANKEIVEVVDFIDIKVGMFSSMYHERLSGYKKEGYLLLSDSGYYQKQIYNCYEYRSILLIDLRNSKNTVVFVVNTYEQAALNELTQACEGRYQLLSSNDDKSKEAGVYANLVIIDKRIVWYGGINPFVKNPFLDDIMRIDDKSVAEDLLKEMRVTLRI